jgi:hypothetical protein
MDKLFAVVLLVIVVGGAIAFSVYINTGCPLASGYMTWHGKECAFTN